MKAEVSILTQVDLQVMEHAECTRAPGTINKRGVEIWAQALKVIGAVLYQGLCSAASDSLRQSQTARLKRTVSLRLYFTR